MPSISLYSRALGHFLLGNRYCTRHTHFNRHKTRQLAFVPGTMYKLLHVPDTIKTENTQTNNKQQTTHTQTHNEQNQNCRQG